VIDDKGRWKSNFGMIYDKKGVMVKRSEDDGTGLTAPVKYYPPNRYDLYQMGGNVAEWTADSAVTEKVDTLGIVDKPDVKCLTSTYRSIPQYDSAISSYRKIRDSILITEKKCKSNKELRQQGRNIFFAEMVMNILHDNELMLRYHRARIVKGGSWADPLIYLICSARQVYNEQYQSSKVGFRVAMDVVYSRH
jgi:formylglycine-generating enzyme required for sulfatase activity